MGTSIDKVADENQPLPTYTTAASSATHNERQPLPNILKYLTAAGLFYSNAAFGCALNSYGPVITTMQHKYDTDDETISKVFTILTGCYMVGALSAGFIYNYVNRQFFVIVILTVMTVVMFLTPHCPTMGVFFGSAAVMGITTGFYDTAQFVWIMEMMQKDCPPYLQALTFFYALGTNMAGWIYAPFLDKDDEEDTTTITSYLLAGDTDSRYTNDSSVPGIITRKEDTKDGSNLTVPYVITAGLLTLAVVGHLLLFLFLRYRPPPPESDTSTVETKEEKQLTKEDGTERRIAGKRIWSMGKFKMVVVVAAFFSAYQGMEMCTFQFFPKFGQNSGLQLSESKSTYVYTGMTAAFAIGRAVAIVIVFKIPVQLILCGNIILALLANILLVGWGNTSLTVLWIASILFGVGISSIYASFSAFAERYLIFTNFVGSIMLVVGSAVAAVYPLIIGSFIEDNPIVLSYVIFFSLTIIILAFGMLSYMTHRDKTRY